jgi:hypothetical protein
MLTEEQKDTLRDVILSGFVSGKRLSKQALVDIGASDDLALAAIASYKQGKVDRATKIKVAAEAEIQKYS